MDLNREIRLLGGKTQQVVRVGDTVRRAPLANADFVRDLLGKLERAGFDAVPRWLGVDERGREIFSFLEGKVALRFGHFGDATLRAAARTIRRYHDATAPFFEGGRVACHHDLSPCNFAFREGVPVAIFDFDTAAEGERIEDLAYAAWTWLNFGSRRHYAEDEQLRRIRLFAEAYGPEIASEPLIEAMLVRQSKVIGHESRSTRMRERVRPWAVLSQAETLRLRDRLASRHAPRP